MRGTKTKAEGTAEKVKGKVEHAWGELTDNDKLKAKGRRDKVRGKAAKGQGRVQNAVDALKG